MTIEKVVAVFTSRDPALSEPGYAAGREIAHAPGFSELLDRHVLNWHELWHRFGISLEEGEERTSRTVNLHVFHLLQTLSRHTPSTRRRACRPGACTARPTAATSSGTSCSSSRFSAFGCPARPRAAALPLPAAARGAAGGAGGRLRRRDVPLAERQRRPGGDPSAAPQSRARVAGSPTTPRLQRHVNARDRLQRLAVLPGHRRPRVPGVFGAELIIEIARFWASIATLRPPARPLRDPRRDGPRRVPRRLPGRRRAGLDNNAYTNVMAVWVLCRALDLLELLPSGIAAPISGERLAVSAAEIERWEDMSRKMRAVFHDGVHQPVRGLRAAGGVRLGGLPSPLRRHQSARPDPRGRGRHVQPVQGFEAGRRPDALLPPLGRRAGRAVRATRLRL